MTDLNFRKPPQRCSAHGGYVYDSGLCQSFIVMSEVLKERERQFSQHGSEDDLEDGTGPESRWLVPYAGDLVARRVESDLRADYETYERAHGKPTRMHLLREELAEAFMESDPARLREELIQVAAVAVSWVEKIDARE